MSDLLITLIAFLLFHHSTSTETKKFTPLVTTSLGDIEGYIGLTVNLNPFYKFEGVPYANPPIGELRFEEPQDLTPWTGTWKANVLTRCMQYDHFNTDFYKNYVVHGDEDCLYVNIYTHSTSSTANLDVLVHIHGGAFMFGRGASYGPEIIMDRPIVYVNFNYRLGPLGFLSAEDSDLPGNIGLRDQIKALKWVKENIKYFGGNPEAITIHGMSAGGASVHFHYLLPASKGLFKWGISQSGCALNPWVIMENAREKFSKVADLVGCPSGNTKERKDCLKKRPARHIVETVKEFQPFLYNPFSPFGVVVDGYWTENPLLPDHPYKLLEKGNVQDLPWIISYTSGEGLYPAADFWKDEHLINIDTNWNEIMPFVLHYNDSVDPDFRNEVSQAIREHYLGNKPVNRETYSILVDIVSDRLFVANLETAARLHNAAVRSNVYSYKFDYKGAVSKSNLRTNTHEDIGVSHGDDTIYVLSSAELNTVSTERDRQMSKFLIDMFTSFMQSGAPNVTSDWKPLTKYEDAPYCQLKISGPEEYKLQFKDEIGQRRFWDSLPFNENAKINSVLFKDEL